MVSPTLSREASPTTAQVGEDEVIEVGTDDSFSDSGSSLHSDTTSLNSSVFHYEYENGRRYHNFRAGKYLLPNDEEEQDRLDLMHHVWLVLFHGSIHLAPLPSRGPRNAIDLGTGTGLWAIEFGDLYPSCSVTGVDLSPIQPSWVPANVKFEVDDIEEPWTFPRNHFDYVHVRNLIGAVKDWGKLVKTAFDHIEPGGYLELQESDLTDFYSDDGTLKDDSPGKIYIKKMVQASALAGSRMDVFGELHGHLEKAGFTDIRVTKKKVPIGTWPKDKSMKEAGRWVLEACETGAEAYGLALFTRVLGMSEKDARELIKGFVEVAKDRKVHMYGYYGIIDARKPVRC